MRKGNKLSVYMKLAKRSVVLFGYLRTAVNGFIEKFNSALDKRFLRTQQFQNFDHLCQEAINFNSFRNANHRYSTLKQKTPNEMRRFMSTLYRIEQPIDLGQRIPLESGVVYFIRFIRGDSKLKLHSESFKVNKDLRYSYVVAEVNIDNQCLVIRQNNEIIQILKYHTSVGW
jgi:putative transposase